MAKIQFFCSNGYPTAKRASGIFDTVDDLGLDEDEWEKLSDDGRFELANGWASNHVEIWWEEYE